MAQALQQEEIDEALENLEGWEHKDDKLQKQFKFDDFKEAMSFILRLSYEAESQVHHPELFNVYNTVEIALTSHDAGGKVTKKDLILATTIESLYNS